MALGLSSKEREIMSYMRSNTIEKIFVVGLALTLGGSFIPYFAASVAGVNGEAARGEADTYGQGLCGSKFRMATCVDNDTDGDGYVSCTVMCENGPIPIECAGKLTLNTGCRIQKARMEYRGSPWNR